MKKNQEHLITGLDVGSSTIKIAVGQVGSQNQEGAPLLQILGAIEVASAGVHRGIINSIEDVVSSISAGVEQAERMVGLPLGQVLLGISGSHIISQTSKGVVAVSKPDSEISEEDVHRAIEASRMIASPLNYEVLHVLPKLFSIDGQEGIKDPVGMTGVRLEVDTQIILGSSAQIKNLTKAVYRAGLEVEDVVLSILASAEAVLTHRQKELGVAVVNIGSSTTSLAVFEEGDVLHTAVIPIGSEHITNDIAIGLRTSIDIAEKIKLFYADCSLDTGSKREEIDLAEAGSPNHEMIKKHYLFEIVQARTEEILRKINQELHAIKRIGLLPAGVVFTGGGSKLSGLIECAKKTLKLPATLGYPLQIMSVTDKVNDIVFTNAVGLVKWGTMMYMDKHSNSFSSPLSGFKFKDVSSHIKKWFKNLIP